MDVSEFCREGDRPVNERLLANAEGGRMERFRRGVSEASKRLVETRWIGLNSAAPSLVFDARMNPYLSTSPALIFCQYSIPPANSLASRLGAADGSSGLVDVSAGFVSASEALLSKVSVFVGVGSSQRVPFSMASDLATSESDTFSSPFAYINLTLRDSISSSAEIALLGILLRLTRSNDAGRGRLRGVTVFSATEPF